MWRHWCGLWLPGAITQPIVRCQLLRSILLALLPHQQDYDSDFEGGEADALALKEAERWEPDLGGLPLGRACRVHVAECALLQNVERRCCCAFSGGSSLPQMHTSNPTACSGR